MKAPVACYTCLRRLSLEATVDIASHIQRDPNRYHTDLLSSVDSTSARVVTQHRRFIRNRVQQQHPRTHSPTTSSAIPRDPGLAPHSTIPTYGLIAWLFVSKNPYATLLVAVLSFSISTAFCATIKAQTGHLAVLSICSKILVTLHYRRVSV